MNHKQRLINTIISGTFICLLSLGACTTQGRNTPQQANPTPGTTPGIQGREIIEENPRDLGNGITNTNPGIRQNNQLSNMLGLGNEDQRAKKIEHHLSKMNGISRVNVAVSGDTCVVGYEPSTASKDDDVIKNSIIKKVKEIDPSIKDCGVSESVDVLDSINRISNDLMNKKPMNEINSEIRQLFDRINPEVS